MGDVLTRVWNFGDEEGTLLLPGTVSLPGPTHTYGIPGYYTVSLTVHDAYRSDTLMQRRYIHVTDIVCNVHLPVVLKDYVPQSQQHSHQRSRFSPLR